MPRLLRRHRSLVFQANVAFTSACVEQTFAERTQHFGTDENQIRQWKDQLIAGVTWVLGDPLKDQASGIDLKGCISG